MESDISETEQSRQQWKPRYYAGSKWRTYSETSEFDQVIARRRLQLQSEWQQLGGAPNIYLGSVDVPEFIRDAAGGYVKDATYVVPERDASGQVIRFHLYRRE